MWGRDTGGCGVDGDPATGRRLRELWAQRSRERRGEPHDDWWTPAVEAVCTAIVRGDGLADACERLGQARARADVSIGDTLADLAALFDALGGSDPPFDLITALASGWVDGGRSREDCTDPLTGLASAAYLRTRIGELYRDSGGLSGAAEHRLVVVGLPEGLDPWRRTARLIVLGHDLSRFFTDGESLALLSRSRMAVLAPSGTGGQDRLDRLSWEVCAEHGARVWSLALPPTRGEALALIGDLGRPPSR
ncbi:hypothetical protein [Streptomonospora salina]|uniref:Uncharacterized protein n=1 Tax=Streptomonospora salina TaxID=104205 RepID=A0A841EDM0_9ACTN|nr:hypothetical protein [Streptomonospora salina]MBB5998550.1 hypothetical protein [Streptomonospora salina]